MVLRSKNTLDKLPTISEQAFRRFIFLSMVIIFPLTTIIVVALVLWNSFRGIEDEHHFRWWAIRLKSSLFLSPTSVCGCWDRVGSLPVFLLSLRVTTFCWEACELGCSFGSLVATCYELPYCCECFGSLLVVAIDPESAPKLVIRDAGSPAGLHILPATSSILALAALPWIKATILPHPLAKTADCRLSAEAGNRLWVERILFKKRTYRYLCRLHQMTIMKKLTQCITRRNTLTCALLSQNIKQSIT